MLARSECVEGWLEPLMQRIYEGLHRFMYIISLLYLYYACILYESSLYVSRVQVSRSGIMI